MRGPRVRSPPRSPLSLAFLRLSTRVAPWIWACCAHRTGERARGAINRHRRLAQHTASAMADLRSIASALYRTLDPSAPLDGCPLRGPDHTDLRGSVVLTLKPIEDRR